MFWLINKNNYICNGSYGGQAINNNDSYFILDTSDLVVEKLTGAQIKYAYKLLGWENFPNLCSDSDWDNEDNSVSFIGDSAEDLFGTYRRDVFFNSDIGDFEDIPEYTESLGGKVIAISRDNEVGVKINGVEQMLPTDLIFGEDRLCTIVNGNKGLVTLRDCYTEEYGSDVEESEYTLYLTYFFKYSCYIVARYQIFDDMSEAIGYMTVYYDMQGNILDLEVKAGDILEVEQLYFIPSSMVEKDVINKLGY